MGECCSIPDILLRCGCIHSGSFSELEGSRERDKRNEIIIPADLSHDANCRDPWDAEFELKYS